MFLRPILQTDEENKENARCKKLRDLLSQVILLLDVSFSEIEKNIPLEHQIILLQSLRNSQDNVRLDSIFWKFWINLFHFRMV